MRLSDRKVLCVFFCVAISLVSCQKPGRDWTIVSPASGSRLEALAASELRRYLYLRTDTLLPISQTDSYPGLKTSAIIVASKGSTILADVPDSQVQAEISALADEEFLIKILSMPGRTNVLIAGGSPVGSLYGAYRFCESLGIRFYLEGDVVPDQKIPFAVPAFDPRGKPLFALRGIQPFHDFPEGPDWWNADEYKAVLAQLPKMGMNFFGLHTYPEKAPNAEPTVWIGLEDEFTAEGKVTTSYPSSYQNTMRGNWGYQAKRTSDFHFGARLLYDRDAYAADVMQGDLPEPKTAQGADAVFNHAGALLNDAFTFARDLGIKTCAGTETPLTVPAWVQDRLRAKGLDPKDPNVIQRLYQGLFSRIARTHPLDFYWFWTFEGWTWSDAGREAVRAVVRDLDLALQAARKVRAPFRLATCGWVLGPPSDRNLFDRVLPKEVAVSCINREVGKAPVDVAFSRISGRSKWAIPWLEDDPALTSPQLWAGRMRRDAADALAYGCDGLLGIHWRTRILSPNVLALARAAWDQSAWNSAPKDADQVIGPINGVYAVLSEKDAASTSLPPVYRDVRDKVSGYRLAVPNGKYAVTLQFSELQMDRKAARVFDVWLEGRRVLEKLDIFEATGRFGKLDFSFLGTEVRDGRVDVEFADRIHYPCIAGIIVQGPEFSRKINCGGPAVADYEADAAETPRFAESGDLYEDWAENQFGPEAARDIAAIFTRMDGRHPVPVTWVDGPGNLSPNSKPWPEVEKEYGFVDELAALRPRVTGTGNLARFDYWLSNFRYMRDVARLDCQVAEFQQKLADTKKDASEVARRQKARDVLLPLRKDMGSTIKTIFGHLLSMVSNTGELGTIANWEQHILPTHWEKAGQELESLLGEKLPREAQLSQDYEGPPRLVVLTTRTLVRRREPLRLRIIVLSHKEPGDAFLFWRSMGKGEFERTALEHVARGVYRVQIPWVDSDIEYYVRTRVEDRELFFPATAPGLSQTVVVMD